MDSDSYRQAGVDTAAGRRFVKQIGESLSSTHSSAVIKGRADFAALFDLSLLKNYRAPLLVSSADGVGTKLHLAALFDRHETVGRDLVAMCLNDLLTTGARPLQFLDYIACGRLDLQRMATIVESIAAGCRQAGCALVGGETAEHPGIMAAEQYDLAGFAVGVVEKERMIDGSRIEAGDILIGLPSSGIHANGFSLVRKLFLQNGLQLPDSAADRNFLLQDILLKPTLIYEPVLRPLLEKGVLPKGMAHITGGGFYENLPRMLGEGLAILLRSDSWNIPSLFRQIASRGQLSNDEMHAVFNMGIGFVVVAAAAERDIFLQALQENFSRHYPQIEGRVVEIGKIVDDSLLTNDIHNSIEEKMGHNSLKYKQSANRSVFWSSDSS